MKSLTNSQLAGSMMIIVIAMILLMIFGKYTVAGVLLAAFAVLAVVSEIRIYKRNKMLRESQEYWDNQLKNRHN